MTVGLSMHRNGPGPYIQSTLFNLKILYIVHMPGSQSETPLSSPKACGALNSRLLNIMLLQNLHHAKLQCRNAGHVAWDINSSQPITRLWIPQGASIDYCMDVATSSAQLD